MGIFDKLRGKKREEPELVDSPISEIGERRDLPEDLEKFRLKLPEIPITERRSALDRSIVPSERPSDEGYLPEEFKRNLPAKEYKEVNSSGVEKIDMVLQKLETIEQRLKLIEHKLERKEYS